MAGLRSSGQRHRRECPLWRYAPSLAREPSVPIPHDKLSQQATVATDLPIPSLALSLPASVVPPPRGRGTSLLSCWRDLAKPPRGYMTPPPGSLIEQASQKGACRQMLTLPTMRHSTCGLGQMYFPGLSARGRPGRWPRRWPGRWPRA